MTTDRRPFAGAALFCAQLFGAEALAQEASVTLSRDVALWGESIRARIEGTGCGGGVRGPYFTPKDGGGLVDIDLDGCNASTEIAFAHDVDLGALYPGQYSIRVFDVARHVASPPLPPFDTATLTVYRHASLDVEVVGAATSAEQIRLRLSGTTKNCGRIVPPVVKGNVIEMTWDDRCFGDPSTVPFVWEEEVLVGPLAAGEYEIRFFEQLANGEPPFLHRETLVVQDAARCVAGPNTLCLQNGRFKVDVQWEDFAHRTGPGHAVPLEGRNDSGLFWFFDEKNVELTLKILNGCGVNGRYWVFLSSGTTVRYDLTVTDMITHTSKVYSNALNESAPLKADTSAFVCGGN